MKYTQKSFQVGWHSRAYASNFDEAFGKKLVGELQRCDRINQDGPRSRLYPVGLIDRELERVVIRVCRRCAHVVQPDEQHGYNPAMQMCVTRKRP